jgi:hypothetical protein
MQAHLELLIAHRLPGRMRLRLSHDPRHSRRLADHIQKHTGIGAVRYTDETRNLLIEFDQQQITPQEIILRAGLALSTDFDMVPVRIRIQKNHDSMGSLSAFALGAILVNHLLQLLTAKAKALPAFQTATGTVTLAAVVEHIIRDFQDKGYFHPEVFSVYYLLLSFIRGEALKGATITWFLTFGRHLLEIPTGSLLLVPEKTDPSCTIHQCEYEVTVKNQKESNRFGQLLHFLPNMLFKAYRQMNLTLAIEDAFIKQMETIADSHDDVIEGLENLDQGFYLKIETQGPDNQ